MVGFWWTKSCKLVTRKLTNFYLKDLTRSENDNMYLDPVVVGEAPPLQPSLKESKPRV